MAKMIQLRNVPDALHRGLKARAALAGMSLCVPYIDGSGVQHNGTGTITAFLQESSDGTQINWLAPNQTPSVFPNAANSGNVCSVSSQCNIFAVDRHLKTPYVMNWNFNVQQALNSSTLLQVAYVANHGVRLYSVTDTNQVNPLYDDGSETIGRPLATNCPVSQGGQGFGGPCFPWLGFFNYLSNYSNSNYNSLQVTLTKRYSHGLYLLAGYTYAHAIDTATSNLAGVPPDSNNYAEERGNGDFDIRHRFTLSAAYEIPAVKSKWQMLEGWQVTSIVNVQTGEPYTLGDFNDDLSLTGEYNDRWNMTGPTSNIHWSQTSPLPYINPDSTVSPFNVNTNGDVVSGTTPAAQLCVVRLTRPEEWAPPTTLAVPMVMIWGATCRGTP